MYYIQNDSCFRYKSTGWQPLPIFSRKMVQILILRPFKNSRAVARPKEALTKV